MQTLSKLCKSFEEVTTSIKISKDTPIVIRLDGKAFHTWVKKLPDYKDEPFSKNLQEIFKLTTLDLMHDTNALVSYSESDSITT